jgi:hypothetical protein
MAANFRIASTALFAERAVPFFMKRLFRRAYGVDDLAVRLLHFPGGGA